LSSTSGYRLKGLPTPGELVEASSARADRTIDLADDDFDRTVAFGVAALEPIVWISPRLPAVR